MQEYIITRNNYDKLAPDRTKGILSPRNTTQKQLEVRGSWKSVANERGHPFVWRTSTTTTGGRRLVALPFKIILALERWLSGRASASDKVDSWFEYGQDLVQAGSPNQTLSTEKVKATVISSVDY